MYMCFIRGSTICCSLVWISRVLRQQWLHNLFLCFSCKALNDLPFSLFPGYWCFSTLHTELNSPNSAAFEITRFLERQNIWSVESSFWFILLVVGNSYSWLLGIHALGCWAGNLRAVKSSDDCGWILSFPQCALRPKRDNETRIPQSFCEYVGARRWMQSNSNTVTKRRCFSLFCSSQRITVFRQNLPLQLCSTFTARKFQSSLCFSVLRALSLSLIVQPLYDRRICKSSFDRGKLRVTCCLVSEFIWAETFVPTKGNCDFASQFWKCNSGSS